MGGLFASPKKPPPPPAPPPPPPMPDVSGTDEARDIARRQAKARRGRRETFVTGELEPVITGKSRLG